MIKKLFTLTLILLGALGMNAQTISGTVTTLNSAPIANHAVYLMSNDSMNPYSATAYTTGSGAYSFTSVPSSYYGFTVSTYDCQQSYHGQYLSTNSGTVNFSICGNGNPSGCNAAFLSTPDSSNVNLIFFTDLSTGNPTSWSWSFGDGSGSSTQNPNHLYASSGSYNVVLIISSSSCSDTVVSTITVGNTTPGCQAGFLNIPDSSNSKKIYFFDSSTGNPTSWTWSFGDGTSSNLQNPMHTYASVGSYSVTLAISSANCSDSTSQTVVVSNGNPTGCQAAFSVIPDSTNSSLYYFTDLSTGNPTSWIWSFGDGTTSSNQYTSHLYSTSGNFTVTLLIQGQNCQSSTSQNIVVSGGSTTYSISGFVTAANQPVYQGNVYLFNSQGLSTGSTSLGTSGNYSFTNLAAGSYKLLAVPDSASTIGSGYAPTYYGDVVIWNNASTINLTSNATLVNISMQAFTLSPGGGTISGNVGTGSKSGVSGAMVNLLDAQLNPVSSTKTDINGDYSFANIADGTYKIWVEIPGKTTTPITITLSSGSQTSSNNDFIVTGSTVIPKTTSINEVDFATDLNLYPNPVYNTLNVNIDITNSGSYSFKVYSISGQVVSSMKIYMQAGNNLVKLNTGNLSQGSYILRIVNTNSNSVQKLFIK